MVIIALLGAKVKHFKLSKFVLLYFPDNQCFQNYEYGRVEYTEFYSTRNICSNAAPKLSLQMQCQSRRRKCTTKVIAGNAVPNLSLQMQRQSCRCKCSAKVVAANAMPKFSLQMQYQSCRCKCSAKVVAANAVTKLSLQMQCQSCRCKCSDKVVAENAVHFTKLGKTLILATLFIALQEANAACNIDNDFSLITGSFYILEKISYLSMFQFCLLCPLLENNSKIFTFLPLRADRVARIQ